MPLKSEGGGGKAVCFQSSLRFFGEGTTLGNRFRKRKRNVLGQGQPEVGNHLINSHVGTQDSVSGKWGETEGAAPPGPHVLPVTRDAHGLSHRTVWGL